MFWGNSGPDASQATGSRSHDESSMSVPSSSATSSDDGQEFIETPEGLEDMPIDQATELVYMTYRRGKRFWRRFTGRPVRAFRRYHRRFVKKRFRERRRHYYDEASEDSQDTEVFLKGKGKGKSTGKGFGRRGNPKDKSGNVMKCHKCGSTEHLQRQCPRSSGGGISSGMPPTMHTRAHVALPASDDDDNDFFGLQFGTVEHTGPSHSQAWDGSHDLPWTHADLSATGEHADMLHADMFPVFTAQPGSSSASWVELNRSGQTSGSSNF